MPITYRFLSEEQKIELINIFKTFLKTKSRVVHSKDIACVSGTFRVLETDPQYKVGLFKEIGSFPCWIRISKTLRKPDSLYNVFGIAIKLYGLNNALNAEKNEQDFLLVTSPVFPVANAQELYFLMKAAANQKPGETRFKKIIKLCQYFFSSYARFKSFLAFSKSLFKSRLPHLFSSQYYSGLAFQFGDNKVMKYKLLLSSKNDYISTEDKNQSYREEVKNRLQQDNIYLDFLIQLQADAKNCPIDDATVKWDETLAPFVKVAEIEIPPQDFQTEERTQLSETLKFNPGYCLPEFKPLGSLNELRIHVYNALSEYRLDEKPQLESEINLKKNPTILA